MPRVQTNNILLIYKIKNHLTKADIVNKFKNPLVDEYIISDCNNGEIHCLTYSINRHDIRTFQKFSVKGVIPQGRTVKQVEMSEIKDILIQMDPNYISIGFRMPLTSDLVTRSVENPDSLSFTEKEIIRLREEVDILKKQNKKLKKKLSTNVTYNTIINFNAIFNVNVNDFGKETLDHLTMEDKKQIIEQKMETAMALKCIEKVHFNPNGKSNNNVFMTNTKNEKLIVRSEGKWDMESDYFRTFDRMTRNVPRHISVIIEDPELPITEEDLIRVTRLINEGLDFEVSDRVYKQLPDLTYSYTKSISNLMEIEE